MLRGRTRVLNACQRCRKQKIKCSGTLPCRTCTGRGIRCDFGAEEKRVIISEKELFDLRTRINQLERTLYERSDRDLSTRAERSGTPHRDTLATDSVERLEAQFHDNTDEVHNSTSRRSSNSRSTEVQDDPGQINISNPLVPEQPVYVSESTGNLRYLGHSSGYAFTQQVLHMLHHDPPSNPSPEIILSLGGREQRSECGRLAPLSRPNVSGLPSRGIALHYLQCLKFRTEPLFYLFDELDFVSHLHQFYKNPLEYAEMSLVWFVHYLVLMAFGKALESHPQKDLSSDMPVSEHFTRALQLLPDMTYLCDHPVEATELFCSIALYLLSVNHRQAAIVYVGQALRLAHLHALHLDLQESIIGAHAVERGRRVWWTVYSLNQRVTANLGLPNFLNDKDITSPLPVVSEVDEDAKALAVHVKICQLLGLLVSRVYCLSDESKTSFVSATRTVLKGAARVAHDLKQYSEKCFGEISRVTAHLELAYHQCIIVACRPVLFYLLKLRTETWRGAPNLSRPSSITGLIQLCIDSATHAIKTLSQLQEHNLLDTFLPFDLECAFSAAFVLIMAGAIDPKILAQPRSIESAKDAISTIAERGNTQAQMRRLEIEQLEDSLNQQDKPPQEDWNSSHLQVADSVNAIAQPEPSPFPQLGDPFFSDWTFTPCLSGGQIMDLAEALDVGDFDPFEPTVG